MSSPWLTILPSRRPTVLRPNCERCGGAISTAGVCMFCMHALPPTAGDGPPLPAPAFESGFTIKDSGKRQEFETGARRDVQDGKGRFDLLDFYALQRLAIHLEKGAAKYGEHNWRKGIPLSRFLSSGARHLHQLIDGQTDEDHAAAVLFNLCGFIWTQREVREGRLPASLNDLPTQNPVTHLDPAA